MNIIQANDDYGNYVEVYTTKGQAFYVSPEDYNWVITHKWHINDEGYVQRYQGVGMCNMKMHREILMRLGHDLTDLVTDHKNGVKNDNRRRNLRPATRSQNGCNRRDIKGEVKEYRGVHKHKNLYRAEVAIGDKTIYCGGYEDSYTASIARDLGCLEYHLEFSTLNHPDKDYSGMTLKEFIRQNRSEKYSSGFKGVSKRKQGSWASIITFPDKKSKSLGTFYEYEEDAARVRDLAVMTYFGPEKHKMMNFPVEDYLDNKFNGMRLEELIEFFRKARRKPERKRAHTAKGKTRSRYLGVSRTGSGKWNISFIYNGTSWSEGGSMESEEEAAVRVDRLRLKVCREDGIYKLNFHLSNYMDLVDEYNLHVYLNAA